MFGVSGFRAKAVELKVEGTGVQGFGFKGTVAETETLKPET